MATNKSHKVSKKVMAARMAKVRAAKTINLTPRFDVNAGVTKLQADMIWDIAHDECAPRNGATPDSRGDAMTWLGNVVYTQADGGVATSLEVGGYITMMKYDNKKEGSDNTIELTQKGFEVLLKLVEARGKQ